MPSRLRSYLLVPLVIALCSIGAGWFSGNRVSAANAPEDSISQSLKSFTQIYSVVEQNFADPVKADKTVYKGAVPGMLNTLDPHSHFFDPKEYQAQHEDQRAHYYGIGMYVQQRPSGVIVQQPFDGSPAVKAGLRAGDAIKMINDKKTDGMNTADVADLLKGPRGTHVQVTIARDGQDKPLVFNIVRDEIPRLSVPDPFWIRPGVAYLQVKQFTDENTDKEMEDKLKKLGEKDIKGMILDLRDNPGGLLNEGIGVVSHFLKRNQLVVSLRGRLPGNNKDYSARSDNGGKDYPMVVLVNRNSASAAEIVSGALQDHDRGWIFGETTFGKGLVQTVFPLSENTGLALTTAQYLTPSGRFIQRDYSNISFLDYYYSTTSRNPLKNPSDVKMTDSGRTVYGGGGITPDEKYEAPKYNKFQIEVLLRKNAFFNFSAAYFGPMQEIKLPKGWEPDESVVNQFQQFLLKNDVQFTEAEFTENHQWVKEQLKHEMYITAFGTDASERVRIEQDPEVAKAVESLPKAKALLDSAKKLLVQRITGQDRPIGSTDVR
jgi:carboxyl-terminal processing protease